MPRRIAVSVISLASFALTVALLLPVAHLISPVHAAQQAAPPANDPASAAATELPQQEEGGPRPLVLRVKSKIVLLDVMVTDMKGNPVNDLKREDFVVTEDKRKQTINSFETPSAHELPPPVKPGTPFNPDDIKSYGQAPVTILLLDELNTHFEDTDFARRSIRAFLMTRGEQLSTPTILLSVSNSHFTLIQNFTRDRATLLKALDRHVTQYPWKLEVDKNVDQGAVDRLDQSLSALEQIAEFTAKIPGRKNLVWVGGGFPTLDPQSITPDDHLRLNETLQHITDTLLATRVTVYAVDPKSQATGNVEITDQDQLMYMEMSGGVNDAGAYMDPFDSSLDFDRLSPMTGGRLVRGLNDIDKQIEHSVDMATQFYTIGYSPTNKSEVGSAFRRIKVTTTRPGLTVTTRLGYYNGADRRERNQDMISHDLNTAAVADLLFSGLKLRVEPIGKDLYAIHVAAPGLTWVPLDSGQNAGSSTAQAEVLGVSLSAKHKILAHTLHTMDSMAPPTVNVHSPSSPADFTLTVPRPKGTAKLRFVVRDTTSGAMGSFDLILP